MHATSPQTCVTVSAKNAFATVFRDGGFDIVIGNPPYVGAKKLKEVIATIKQCYVCYSGAADLSVYFYEKGLSLCNKNGTLTYICTNKFFNTGYGRKLRAFILSHSLRQILNFEQCEVFENVLVSSAITIIKQRSPSPNGTIKFFNWYKLKRKDFLRSFQHNNIKLKDYFLSVMSADEWSFSDAVELNIKTKIEKGNSPLGNIAGVYIYRGVTTGYNPAFIITDKQCDALLAADAKNANIIRNMLQGRNIRKWYYNAGTQYLLQTGFNINIKNEYPSIYKHLLNFYEKLIVRADKGKNWWNLRACAFYPEFVKNEKIIWGLTADKWAFAYDDRQHYLPSNGCILTSTTLPIKYILGILNSKVLEFYFSFIGVMTAGGAYTLKHDTISKLPFPTAEFDQQQTIIKLVDRILEDKAANPAADTTKEEREIDNLVYQLYGLTDEEIAVVEAPSKKGKTEAGKSQTPDTPPRPGVTP